MIKTITVDTNTIKYEYFDSSITMTDTIGRRKITDSRFSNSSDEVDSSWTGVKSYGEALNYLKNGWDSAEIDRINKALKAATLKPAEKRVKFFNNVCGFAPVVPLALLNVPNSMVDMTIKSIKTKVIDFVYFLSASAYVSSEEIITAGTAVMEAIVDLEKHGYRVNLYSAQDYGDNMTYKTNGSYDIVFLKLKSASRALDVKRLMFPLIHTAMLRTIGFSWYERFPIGTYRDGYGYPIDITDSKTHKFTVDICEKVLNSKSVVVFTTQTLVVKGDKSKQTKYITDSITQKKS